MVYLSTRFLFSAFYLSTRASHLMAWVTCPGDTTASGCWMCKGSKLGACWDDAVEKIDNCERTSLDLPCLCTAYSRLSHCWMQGTCCSEFSPTLAAATNLCNLATQPTNHITKNLFDRVLNDAINARYTIYHNDRGTDVPKLQMYVPARSDDLVLHIQNATARTRPAENHYEDWRGNINHKIKDYTSYKSKDSTNYKSKDSTNYRSKDDITYKSKSATRTLEGKKSASKLQGTISEKTETQRQQSEVYGPTTNQKAKNGGLPAHEKIHHQAKCARTPHKCQTEIASQYRKARRDKSSQTLVKRDQIQQKSSKCGLDFQNVPYPSEIPPTVAKEYAKFGK